MTLFELAKKNMRRNLKQYVLYFYPMVFSIAIYFTFVSLQYNQQVNESSMTLGKISPALSAASVLLYIFASLFIWYSNAFFIKRRKKEIGLYSLFGMRKKQVSKLLLNEIFILGGLALIAGVGIGLVFSKLFAMILVKLMDSQIIVTFEISPVALFQTIVAFSITILLAALYNYRIIYKNTLLQLFKAEKRGETVPKAAFIPAALSLLLLGFGYAALLQPSTSTVWKEFGFLVVLFSMLALFIGTYLFIRALSIWVLKIIFSYKKIAWKGVHLISISSLLYRIKGNVIMLSVLALLTTLTLFSMGTTFSLYNNMSQISKMNLPHSFMYSVPSEENSRKIEEMMDENGSANLIYSETLPSIQVHDQLGEISRLWNGQTIILYSESDINRLAKEMGLSESFSLKDHEAVAFYDGNLDQNEDPYSGKRLRFSDEIEVKIVSYEPYTIFNLGSFMFPIVISDQLFEETKKTETVSFIQFDKIKNEKTAGKLATDIHNIIYEEQILVEESNLDGEVVFVSFYEQYKELTETYGLLLFISSFLGIVFLLSTGSMLHYKQLTEATADQSRYATLKKIGMNRKQIRKSVKNQLRVIFIIPLLVAIAHSSIIMTALSAFLQLNMLYPFLTAIASYIAIYYGYYLLTVSKYSRLVTEN